jgi:DNA-binding SARP family transcriptional activator
MEKKTAINKITPPKLPKVVLREKLFALLDEKQHYRATWISGMAGSGKTTLVASYLQSRNYPSLWYKIDEGDSDPSTFFYYLGLAAEKASPHTQKPMPLLTPEYFLGIHAFAPRYFENLCGRLTPPFFIVFDDYHTIPPANQFHKVFFNGISNISPDIHIIILSRATPPSIFAGMTANNKMRIIGSNNLRLNYKDSREIIAIEAGESPPREITEKIHEKTQGWAAGIILIAKSIKTNATLPDFLDIVVPSNIFDYFSGELFDKMNKATKKFLLKTAFFNKMTISMAEKLTGQADTHHILSKLQRNNVFTERIFTSTPTYQYHSLFRKFLITRATDTFNRQEILLLKQCAATLSAASNLVDDAVELFFEAGDMAGLSHLIQENAMELITQGRNKTLERWIKKIPEKTLKTEPWLLYWLGISCLHFSAGEARGYFENAFHLFESRQDMDGLYLSWTGIIDSTAYEWSYFTTLDPWIEWLENSICPGHSFPSKEIEAKVAVCMMFALLIRKPEHPDILQWVERALSLSRESSNFNLQVQAINWAMTYSAWIGDFAKIEIIRSESKGQAKSHKTTSAMMIQWKWLDISTRLCTMTDIGSVMDEIHEALLLIHKTGLHVWEHIFYMPGIFASLLLGKISKAEDFLKKFEILLDNNHSHSYTIFHHFTGLYNLLKGNNARALTHAKTAVKLSDETGYVFTTIVCRIQLAFILHEQEKTQEALKELGIAYFKALDTKSSIYKFMCLLVKSKIKLDQNEKERGLELLREAMFLGKTNNYMNMIWWWHPSMMAQLCTKALTSDIETKYVTKLIQIHKLVPDFPPYHIKNWPWALRIYTFEHFQIIKDNAPLQFKGKTQKKPLELLRILITSGGKEISIENIIDTLWYEADGDMAQSAFSSTLNRLRALIGHKEAIQLRDGKLTIDQNYCWIDMLAFLNILNKADDLWKKDKKKKSSNLYKKAITIYTGHFLAEEAEKNWIIPMRERLKNSFLTAITKLGMHLEQEKEFKKAIEYYKKGLAVDNLEEKFYQRLIVCFHDLGRYADAAKAYSRCKDILKAVLGVVPSERTEKLYKKTPKKNKS